MEKRDKINGGICPEFPGFCWKEFCNLLIKEDLRDLPWSIGILEYWNDGLRGRRTIDYPTPDGMMEYWKGGTVVSKAHDLGLVRQIALMDNGVLDSIEETAGVLADHWG